MVGLTAEQIEGLKRHKYAREGISFLGPYMDHFWWKLARNVPLWVTPNLLTLTGLVINIASTLLVIILDYNAQGNVSGLQWTNPDFSYMDFESEFWAFLLCAYIGRDILSNFTVFLKLSHCFQVFSRSYSNSILMTSSSH